MLLNTCDINAKGATSIAEAIRINVTVTKLDLNSNQISDAGATAMADALRGNEVLSSPTANPRTALFPANPRHASSGIYAASITRVRA